MKYKAIDPPNIVIILKIYEMTVKWNENEWNSIFKTIIKKYSEYPS